MTNYISEFIAIPGGMTIHYYRTGGALPPLVLVHGVTDDGLCWSPIADKLSDLCDVILVDTRGHGLSSASTVWIFPPGSG